MKQIRTVSVIVLSIMIFTTYSIFPNAEAKPITDDSTGIRINCKSTQFAASCSINDSKNGIAHIHLTNGAEFGDDIYPDCAKRETTKDYDPTFAGGDWRLTITNCNNEESSFHLVLENGVFTLQ